MENNVLVNFNEVSMHFANKMLLDKVSFHVDRQTITTLIGQNGAGKSTIAKLIVGLEKASSGSVKVAKDIRIGYVPQKISHIQNIPLNCVALLDMLAPKYDAELLNEISEFIDIDGLLNKDIADLSGGQMQKILLVGTILSKPDLLLLDEPTQYLDVASQQQFYKMLSHLKERLGLAIFMISHDLFTVMKNSDQVICLNRHVCCSGKPADIDANEQLKSAISEIGLYVHDHDHKHE